VSSVVQQWNTFQKTPTTRCTQSRAAPLSGLKTCTQSLLIYWIRQTRKLEALKDVTHVIFGAYVEKDTPAERSSVNVALLRNRKTVDV